MSTGRGGALTRQNLLRCRRRLERVTKGVSLLRRKREALVAELFRIARPAADQRVSIGDRAAHAYPALLAALAGEGSAGLRVIGWPWRELRVEIRPAQVWGIPIAELLQRPPIRRSLAARGTPPGSTGTAPVTAATEFEQLIELLLDAANRETLLRRLGRRCRAPPVRSIPSSAASGRISATASRSSVGHSTSVSARSTFG